MEAQHMNAPADATPEVIATLRDLAELSWRAASLAVNTDVTHIVAFALLEQLLILCGAQRGAVLTGRYTTTGESISVLSPSPRKLLRPLAIHGMHEEEALALLATFAPERAGIQILSGVPSWVICRLPMSASSDSRQEKSAESAVGAAKNQADVPFLAVLLLGWTGTDNATTLAAAEKGCQLLPLVGDAVNAVLANLLLGEHVRELENLTDRKALHEMELLKAEMLASVSHELRSPLASIKGYTTTLLRHERRISREERLEFLVAISEASDRLMAVIDRLLEMSQLETDSISMDYSSVNLAHLVREALTAIEQHVGQTKRGDTASQTPGQVSFVLRLEDGHGKLTGDEPLVQVDRSHLREVLDHLLENARSYSPEGGTIDVVLRPVSTREYVARRGALHSSREEEAKSQGAERASFLPGNEQMIEICVRDRGIGIPREHLERIFERFHRVDTRLTREVNGLGLGLAICKRIVELHHGVIWAESEPGQGSTFHVLLPMHGGM